MWNKGFIEFLNCNLECAETNIGLCALKVAVEKLLKDKVEFALCLSLAAPHTSPSSLSEETTEQTLANGEKALNTWKIENRSQGWTSWSEWSTCSRSCDGGISHQIRRCNSPSGCKGEPVRYRICNMQPCPEFRDFREHQCASFNDIPYEGALLKWSPHYDDARPCSLTCRGQPSLDNIVLEDGLQADDEGFVVVARLSDKVQDGTRCRPGSLDMCIDGICKRVGCDLRIGSAKKVDACGVCGGDGTSCAQPLYHWETTPMSLCSVTCGGGYKMSRPVCQNRLTGVEVEEQLCNASQKPEATIMQCNHHKCPPKWTTGEWGACSVSCGGGSRLRQVHCMEEVNSTKNKVNEHNCRSHKPRYQEPCNQMDCPKWHTSSWSGCSVSCGEGVQVRGVECRDARDLPSVLCETYTKPATTQACSTGIACPQINEETDNLDELLPGLYHTQPLVQPYPPIPPKAERLIGEQIVPSESTFIADEWGPCSVSCGEGIRKREVHCKIFLEFSRTIAKLPDRQCNGPKPTETERCVLEPCSMANRIDTVRDGYMEGSYPDPFRSPGYDSSSTIRVAPGSPGKTYSWKEHGYTHCSASCLGGVQELIVHCVQDDNQRIVSPFMCSAETKPEILVRTCNDHACPPRWNYSDYQPCTKSCGIGIQTREVNCIHEVTQGGGNTVVIPNNMCPQPAPPDRQYCNVLDCPVKWHISEWSKCSKSCGGGIKERKVECKQIMAQNHVVERPPTSCPSTKPQERKPCNTKSCVLESDRPQIVVSNSSYIQHDPKKKKISVKIGGSATVFYGTTIKIKCHVKRFNRTKIQWAKDQNYLVKSKKFKISKKGALRIHNLMYKDSGVYTCIAGKSSADLSLTVKSKPGEFPNSEEIERHNANRVDKSRLEMNSDGAGSRNDEQHTSFIIGDDQSHEQRPSEGPKPLPKKQIGKSRNSFKPTMPPILSHADDHLHMNRLDQMASTPFVFDEDQDGVLPSQLPASSVSLKPPLYGDIPSSSAPRAMPHFQQLIINLQAFTSSRSHRTITISHEDITTEVSLIDNPESQIGEDHLRSALVLEKDNSDTVKFEWVVTEWTKCSQTCGNQGFQMRSAQCMFKFHNTSQNVESELCDDAGIHIPVTIQKCGMAECPKWKISAWTPCERSRCVSRNTAMQKREVSCQVANMTDVDTSLCSEHERPTNRQECFNEKCIGVWKVGNWSECTASCDKQGVKYRILQCVWYGTKKAAGNACKNQPRPSVMKTCKGNPCSADNICRDHSKFCQNVRTLNLCKIRQYQQQCCQTCHKDD